MSTLENNSAVSLWIDEASLAIAKKFATERQCAALQCEIIGALRQLQSAVESAPKAGLTVADFLVLLQVFDEGWRMASEWGQSDHLLSDLESPQYLKERGERLLSITRSTPGTTTERRAIDLLRTIREQDYLSDDLRAQIDGCLRQARARDSADLDPGVACGSPSGADGRFLADGVEYRSVRYLKEGTRMVPIDALQEVEMERDYFKRRVETMYRHSRKDCWYWQGDGYDHIESLTNACPVVIRADDLRGLIAQFNKVDADATRVLVGAGASHAPAVQPLPQGVERIVDQIHSAIMNLECVPQNMDAEPNQRLAYKVGHRDARHAAAGLVVSMIANLG